MAILCHDFMLDKAAVEHCREGFADIFSKLSKGCGVGFLVAERHCGNLDGTFQRLFYSDTLLLAELGRDPGRPPIFPASRASGSGDRSEKEKEHSCPGGQASK